MNVSENIYVPTQSFNLCVDPYRALSKDKLEKINEIWDDKKPQMALKLLKGIFNGSELDNMQKRISLFILSAIEMVLLNKEIMKFDRRTAMVTMNLIQVDRSILNNLSVMLTNDILFNSVRDSIIIIDGRLTPSINKSFFNTTTDATGIMPYSTALTRNIDPWAMHITSITNDGKM